MSWIKLFYFNIGWLYTTMKWCFALIIEVLWPWAGLEQPKLYFITLKNIYFIVYGAYFILHETYHAVLYATYILLYL